MHMQALPLTLASSEELEALVAALSPTPSTHPASSHAPSAGSGLAGQKAQHTHRQQQQQQQQQGGASSSWSVQLLRGFLALQRAITQVAALPPSKVGRHRAGTGGVWEGGRHRAGTGEAWEIRGQARGLPEGPWGLATHMSFMSFTQGASDRRQVMNAALSMDR